MSGFSPEAIEKIRRYSWPGNVRELQNSIERAVLLSDEETVDAHSLTQEGQLDGRGVTAEDTMNLEELERGRSNARCGNPGVSRRKPRN